MIVFSRFHDPFDIVVMNARVLWNNRFIPEEDERKEFGDDVMILLSCSTLKFEVFSSFFEK